jgi:hypothetical protein
LGALRRPTRTAWVVNSLARAEPTVPAQLSQLAAELGDAQRAKDGRRLRELSAERGELIDSLTQQALDVAGVTDVPPALRLEVSQTLTAALADPETAATFAAGTLTRAVQWSGFGVLPVDAETGPVDDTESGSAGGTESRGAGAARPGGASSRPAAKAPSRATAARAPAEPRPGRTRLKAVPDAAAKPDAAAARRQAEAAERAAREAAERAAAQQAAQRRQYEEAERAVAEAADRAAEAGAAEDRLETEVRDLEERLTRARTELRDARLRARQTEGAERRARQALSRLPDKPGAS